MAPRKNKEDDLLVALRDGILGVLRDPTISVVERAKMIEAGTRLLAIEAKLRDRGQKRGFFAGASADE
jgi:hypothetical protein